jgi:hypothetical protein
VDVEDVALLALALDRPGLSTGFLDSGLRHFDVRNRRLLRGIGNRRILVRLGQVGGSCVGFRLGCVNLCWFASFLGGLQIRVSTGLGSLGRFLGRNGGIGLDRRRG